MDAYITASPLLKLFFVMIFFSSQSAVSGGESHFVHQVNSTSALFLALPTASVSHGWPDRAALLRDAV